MGLHTSKSLVFWYPRSRSEIRSVSSKKKTYKIVILDASIRSHNRIDIGSTQIAWYLLQPREHFSKFKLRQILNLALNLALFSTLFKGQFTPLSALIQPHFTSQDYFSPDLLQSTSKMKFTLLIIACAALVHASSRADIPPCAIPCLDNAVHEKTRCATDDYACICKDQDAVKSAASNCVISKCGAGTALSMFSCWTCA